MPIYHVEFCMCSDSCCLLEHQKYRSNLFTCVDHIMEVGLKILTINACNAVTFLIAVAYLLCM